MDKRPYLLITIDTEGDDLWSRPKRITTANINYLPRFQEICDSYGFKPTYLVNYEMACCSAFKEFGLNIISNKVGEIGMHLHAWNNPPLVPLTKDDYLYQPYLIEYPHNIINEKIKIITDLLENNFNQKMISHRAGRWAFNAIYTESLIDQGYKVDCSVTPLRSWKNNLGDPNGDGGIDYSFYPNQPYWTDSNGGNKTDSLLEIPVTIVSQNNFINYLINNPALPRKCIINQFHSYIKPIWLRPNGNNLETMKIILDYKIQAGDDYAMLTLHSSELMPGGSPTFTTESDIEILYDHLQNIFNYSKDIYQPGTLTDYYNYYIENY